MNNKNNTGKNNSGYRNSGNSNSGDWNSGDWNSGNSNSGDWNSGYKNSGNSNTGDYNTGNRNSGDWNSGYRNSGDWNSGYRNSGDWNSGYKNSGNSNSSDWNSGDYNSGDCNSGNCNSGNYNSGWFNTNEPKMRLFNKDCDFTRTELIDNNLLPSFSEFYLTKWISISEMSEQEKIDNPTFHTCLGYLKKYSYKEAWANFWRDTTEENRNKFLALPNFDADIFKEITGIDVSEKEITCDGKVVEIDGKKYKLTAI